MGMKTTAVLLGAAVSFSPTQANAFKGISNATKVEIAHELEEIVVPNAQGGGGNADKFARIKSIKLSLAARRISVEVLQIALGGSAVTVAAGAVAAEPHTVAALDALVVLDALPDASQTMTVTPVGGGTAYVLGEDYERHRLGIIPLPNGAMTVDGDFEVAYTKAKHLVIEAMLNTGTERAVLIDGANEKTAALYAGIYHRVNFGPAKNWNWTTDNQFCSFDIDGEALQADWITEAGKSKFYKVLSGEDLV